ncbi:MAG: hypothetical protein AAFY59_14845 [Pseudomonadota bacterium]
MMSGVMTKGFVAVLSAFIAISGAAFAQGSTDVIGDPIPPSESLPSLPDKGEDVIGDPLPPEPASAGTLLKDEVTDKPKTDLPEPTEASSSGSKDGAGELKDTKLPSEASLAERMSLAQAEIKALQSRVAENSAAIAELRMLLEEDRDSEPRPAEGAPPIAVSCNDDPDCMACMRGVSADLETHLVVYERLRAIYARYKTFQSRVIIMGDMLAGFHSVSQTAWGTEKLRMQEALAGLQRAYDAKLAELVTTLGGLLDRVDACHPEGTAPAELEFHRRLFVTFITNAYRRTD